MTEDAQDKQGGIRKAHSRWTDNPFRSPNSPPEQLEWLNKRNEATRSFRGTGDDTMAIEIGLFPSREAQAELKRQRRKRKDNDAADEGDD